MSKRVINHEVKKQAIWWAVDPLSDDTVFHEHAIQVMTPFARALGTTIQPVMYIDCHLAPHYSGQTQSDHDRCFSALKIAAENRLHQAIPRAHKSLVAAPLFLTHRPNVSPTLRDKVKAINAEAKKHSAVFIALHTHAHRGLKRLFVGSFAETYMLNGTTSMLIFNPACTPSAKVRHAVFPTDFSPESVKAFKKFQIVCSKLKAAVSLVHKLPWWLSAGISKSKLKNDAELQLKRSEKALKELATKARVSGSNAKAILLADGSSSESPATSILKYSRDHHVDVIALAAQSEGIMTSLLGTTSRTIVRESHCPVLVYRR